MAQNVRGRESVPMGRPYQPPLGFGDSRLGNVDTTAQLPSQGEQDRAATVKGGLDLGTLFSGAIGLVTGRAGVMNFIQGLFTSGAQREAEEAANLASQRQYQQAMELILEHSGQSRKDITNTFQRLGRRAKNVAEGNEEEIAALHKELNEIVVRGGGEATIGLQELRENVVGSLRENLAANSQQFEQYSSGVVGGYERRLAEGMGFLDSAGEQARKDIGEFEEYTLASQISDLTARGLGSTTIRSNMQASSAERESEALNRLRTRLGRERADLYSGLSGDRMQAQQQLGLLGYGVSEAGRAAIVNAEAQFGERGLAMDQATRDELYRLAGDYGSQQLANQQRLGDYRISSGQEHENALFGIDQGDYDRMLAQINSVQHVGPDPNLFHAQQQSLGGQSAGNPSDDGGGGGGTPLGYAGSTIAMGMAGRSLATSMVSGAAGGSYLPGWGTIIGAGLGAASYWWGSQD